MEIDFCCHPNSCGQDTSLRYSAGKYLDLVGVGDVSRVTWRSRRSVEATVPYVLGFGPPENILYAADRLWLYVQSPSERWDGDWALSQTMLGCFGFDIGQTHQGPYRTVAATDLPPQRSLA